MYQSFLAITYVVSYDNMIFYLYYESLSYFWGSLMASFFYGTGNKKGYPFMG